MWQWQCHKTRRQVMLRVCKCKARLSPNAAGSVGLLEGLKADMDGISWQLCWHDARLTDMAVIGNYACKEP
ncbi:hypothetical protein CsSME_00011004 [Camellia sinensis var. sinensis]